MIRPEATAATVWPRDVAGTEKQEPLDRALEELVQQDHWIDDFIERLNHAIDDIVRKKH